VLLHAGALDSVVLPMALLILASIIRSVTLMIIPILNIFITILAEFLVMYPVALSMDVVSFTPSLMMSITIAMSIDYSLFLLSRFMEELSKVRLIGLGLLWTRVLPCGDWTARCSCVLHWQCYWGCCDKLFFSLCRRVVLRARAAAAPRPRITSCRCVQGRSVEEAIPFMVAGAGHTILVSGGTLVCCFLGMLIFPMDMLRSVGIGASVRAQFDTVAPKYQLRR